MHLRARQALFWLFTALFVVAAPTVVLYTAGYRYNSTSGRLQRTGVVAISTNPRGASIRINGQLEAERSPLVIKRLMPGTYSISLERKNYHSWTQEITVESGRTAYISATLLADAEPELLLEEQFTSAAVSPDGRMVAMFVENADVIGEVWLYDIASRSERQLAETTLGVWEDPSIVWTNDGTAIVVVDENLPVAGWNVESGNALSQDTLISALNLLPEYSFVDNGANIELHRSTNTADTPVTLLPLGSYNVLYRDDQIALFNDERGHVYRLTLATDAVASIDLPVGLLAWSDELNLFLASDHYELATVNPSNGQRMFITRQSTPITAIDWHPDGQVLFVATHDSVVAIDRQMVTTRVTTTLAQDVDVSDLWIDQSGRNAYFLGSQGDLAGIYRLKLVK